MLKTLENDILRLTVDTHGAEIHSLVAKDTGIEYIWQADLITGKDMRQSYFLLLVIKKWSI